MHKGNDLPNWRPITILNTDDMILEKVLFRRLNKVITKLIADDECGFMKGRNIATILRTTDNIIHYVRQLPGLSVAEDFTKAFDTVSKMFI